MSQKINVAIIGTGMSLSVFHRPSILYLSDKFNLHTVLERSGKGRAKEVCGDSIKVATTLEQIVEDKEVDLVCVHLSSTPSTLRFLGLRVTLHSVAIARYVLKTSRPPPCIIAPSTPLRPY